MIHWANAPKEDETYQKQLASLSLMKKNIKRLAILDAKEDSPRFDDLAAISVKSVYYWGSKFTDLDYGLETRSTWQVCTAFNRILAVAVERERETSPERRAAMEDFITRHLDFLAFYKYKNPNWWYNEVGVPLALSYILALCEDFLPRPLFNEALILLEPSSVIKHPEYIPRKTGANLTWMCMLSMRHGALVGDPAEIRLAIKLVADGVRPGAEGLQSDGSFFQHGRLLYSLGYGRSYLVHLANMISMLDGTEFSFPNEIKENVAAHVLDGIRYFTHGGYANPLSTGREYTRPEQQKLGSATEQAIKALAECDGMPRAEELRALSAALERCEPTFVGAKYFDVARMLVFNTGRLYFAFQGADPGICTSEIINAENVLGYNRSYGTVTAVMRSGNEYDSISQIMDHSRVPGTTARLEDDVTLLSKPDFTRVPVRAASFGGACDGRHGVCFLATSHEDIGVTVTAFATANGAVLLGAGIYADSYDNLATTVEQSLAEGEYTVCDRSVTHRSIKYTNLDTGTHFDVKIEHKSAPYARNLPPDRGFGMPSTVESDVFLLTIPTSPDHPSYAYAITAKEDSPDAKILANTAEVQAILTEDGYLLAAFHEDAKIDLCGESFCGRRGEAFIKKVK